MNELDKELKLRRLIFTIVDIFFYLGCATLFGYWFWLAVLR